MISLLLTKFTQKSRFQTARSEKFEMLFHIKRFAEGDGTLCWPLKGVQGRLCFTGQLKSNHAALLTTTTREWALYIGHRNNSHSSHWYKFMMVQSSYLFCCFY